MLAIRGTAITLLFSIMTTHNVVVIVRRVSTNTSDASPAHDSACRLIVHVNETIVGNYNYCVRVHLNTWASGKRSISLQCLAYGLGES